MSKNQYKIIENFNMLVMEENITDLLNKGWEIKGGVQITCRKNGTIYSQAMVKYDHTYLHFNADGNKFRVGDKIYDISLTNKENKS